VKGSPRNRPAPAVLIALAALLPILLLAYVLSLGPTGWLVEKGYIEPTVWDAIYMPLGIVAEYCPPLRSFLDWYVWICSGA
jgi:hypothetical protein